MLIARAGGWVAAQTSLAPFPSSATGRPLIGLGAIRQVEAWNRHLAWCGGDLQRRSWMPRTLPEPGCVYLENPALARFATLMEKGHPPRDALQHLIRDRRFRAVHLPALDVYHDSAMRVLRS